MSRRNAASAIALALAALAPAAASLPAPKQAEGPATPEEIRSGILAAAARGDARDCGGLLAVLDPLVPRVAPSKERTAIQLMRLRCVGVVGRAGEIPGIQHELAEAAPRDPAVRSLGVMVSVDAGQFGEAADQISAIADEQPAVLALIPGTLWRAVAQKLTESGDLARRGKALVALAQADWQPLDKPEMRDGIAQGAIEVLLDAKDVDAASALLPRIEMPEVLAGMAIERRFQPLWPAIEAQMGPHDVKAVDRFAAGRLAAFANSPNDPRARRDAIRSFILLGRLDDAIGVGGQVPVNDGMDEDDVDTVRYEAQATAALGDRGKAAARLAQVAALDLTKVPDAASAIVGLAEMLDEAGRPQEALQAARDGMSRGAKALSPWGVAWLRRTELCALSTLGQAENARAVGDQLKALAHDNEPAAIEGLLCAKRIDEAAAIAVATLATSEGAGRLADQFQPRGAQWAGAESRLRMMWVPLLARRDVRTAFDRAVRILPKSLWPAVEPRPVPRGKLSEDPDATT